MEQETRWRQRLGDFEKSVGRLQEALNKKEFNELEKDGVIQRFEFTFELAWKTLKDFFEDQGFTDVSSPKKAIQKAFSNSLIKDGDLWIEMQEDRNRMSHLYDQTVSKIIFNNIKDKYAIALDNLAQTLKKESQ